MTAFAHARRDRLAGNPPNFETLMIVKAPFRLPDGWLNQFGYPGHRRFVGLYWEPCGDESCYCDGVSSACGLCDNWLYLAFVRQPHVRRWIDEIDIRLGNSEDEARHWLVAEVATGDLWAMDRFEASATILTEVLRTEADPTGSS